MSEEPILETDSVASKLAKSGALAAFIRGLSPIEKRALEFEWRNFWARPQQLAPKGDWVYWLVLAGRGFGKTRTGAEWVREIVGPANSRSDARIALVGRTAADVRDVMVCGESGILAVSPPWNRPEWQSSKRRLIWPNGAIATTYSAEKPDQLRGPQHSAAWCDEVAAWQYSDSWDQLNLGLRLGSTPKCIVTTTPRPIPLMRDLVANPLTVITKGSTYDNRANLAKAFINQIIQKFDGSRLGRQELFAEMLDDVEGALWSYKRLDELRVRHIPENLVRIVVALDPSVSANGDGDECGIIVAGLGQDGHGYILQDASGRHLPHVWAKEAIHLYDKWKADRIIAEVNQGGALVENTLRTLNSRISYKAVHASVGKRARAEPVSALYEQCLASGSRITTARGQVKIEDVTTDDYVLTRKGFRRVVWSGQTGMKPVIRIDAGGHWLYCTDDHPIFTFEDGFIRSVALRPNVHHVLVCKSTHVSTAELASVSHAVGVSNAPQSKDGKHGNLLENSFGSVGLDTISSQTDTTEPGDLLETSYYIGLSGGLRKGASQQSGTYITLMAIRAIMILVIWWRLFQKNIKSAIHMSIRATARILSHRRSWIGGKPDRPMSINAIGVERASYQQQQEFDFARQSVTLVSGTMNEEKRLTAPVYNLEVEDVPEFFAENILVHNCRVHHVGTLPKLEDQLCFVAGTMICTNRGQVPIEEVTTKDIAYTTAGWRRIINAEMTGIRQTQTVVTKTGLHLRGTPNHPIMVDYKGWTPISELEIGDMVTVLDTPSGLAADVVTAVSPLSYWAEPVFNLTVEGDHEYFANHILVHNCTWDPMNSNKSPDRLDALVWALTELMVNNRMPVRNATEPTHLDFDNMGIHSENLDNVGIW